MIRGADSNRKTGCFTVLIEERVEEIEKLGPSEGIRVFELPLQLFEEFVGERDDLGIEIGDLPSLDALDGEGFLFGDLGFKEREYTVRIEDDRVGRWGFDGGFGIGRGFGDDFKQRHGFFREGFRAGGACA